MKKLNHFAKGYWHSLIVICLILIYILFHTLMFQIYYNKGYKDAMLKTLPCEMLENVSSQTIFGGSQYDIYECYVNIGNWEDYWTIE